MTQYDEKNKIVVFKNDKQGVENRPDMTGKVNVEGKEYYVSLWTKTPNNGGDKFLSGTIQEPKKKEQSKKESAEDELPSDMPF